MGKVQVEQLLGDASYSDDVVVIRQSEKPGEPSVVTINCPDKTGLGCDLCRIILFFGLSIERGDVTQVLCDLELTIRRVKVSTTPDGKVVDLFFITDTRELLHTTKRKEETYDRLKAVLGETMIKCEIELPSTEIAVSLQPSSSLPHAITEETFILELPEESPMGSSLTPKILSVKMDNSLSRSHTLIQILCRDHKGLLYDIMRTLKDYNIQLSYGRFYANQYECCELDLFVMQVDGKKIIDPNKQKALCSRLRMELVCPLRVTVLDRGPETELLVANPVELSGKGRPLVFYDITLALKMLNTCIFLAEIGRHMIGGREWEVYRVLLDDSYRNSATKSKIEEGVVKMLMGWE